MRRPAALVGAAFLAVLVAVLWFGFLGHPPLWTDEAFTLQFASSWKTVGQDVHPPLYYALVHLVFDLVPSTIEWARAFSAVSFIGAVAVWALLASRWRRELRLPAASVVTVVVLSLFSPHALLFGRMARYFGLAALLLALGVTVWWRARTDRRWAVAAVVVAVHVVLGIVNQPTLIVALGAETLTVLLRDRPQLRRQIVFAVVTALITVVVLALLPVDNSKLGGGEDVNHLVMAGVAVVLPLWSMTVGETVSPFNPITGLLPLLAWIVVGVAAVGALRSRTRRSDEAPAPPRSGGRVRTVAGWVDDRLPADPAVLLCIAIVVAQVAVQVAENFTVDLAHTAIQAPKYFLPVAPVFYLLVGIGVDRMRSWRRGGAVLAVAGLCVAVGWGFGIADLREGTHFLYPSYALPWNDVVKNVDLVVADRAAQGERVAVVSSDIAFQQLLAHTHPRADIVDLTLPVRDNVVYHGAEPGVPDTIVYVTRQKLNVQAEANVDAALYVALRTGYAPLRPDETFGHVDPGLRRVQEWVSSRDLEPYLVKVVVVTKPRST